MMMVMTHQLGLLVHGMRRWCNGGSGEKRDREGDGLVVDIDALKNEELTRKMVRRCGTGYA